MLCDSGGVFHVSDGHVALYKSTDPALMHWKQAGDEPFVVFANKSVAQPTFGALVHGMPNAPKGCRRT